MKAPIPAFILALSLPFLPGLHPPTVSAQGTAFSYQGRLNDDTGPANGIYDFRFALYDALMAGSVVAGPLTNPATTVSNGVFSVTLDFGPGIFTGADRWLEIGVRTNGGAAYTALAPRQRITSVPYAVTAQSASTAFSVTGPISAAQLPSGTLFNGASGVTLSGSFSGSGAELSGVDLRMVNAAGLVTWTTNDAFVPKAAYSVGATPGAIVAADVNGDGRPDLITANSADDSLTVLTNSGAGTFALATVPVAGDGPAALRAMDVNGDGKLDLVCANANANTVTVLTNYGAGGLVGFLPASSPGVGSRPSSIAAADVNGDGKVDLISANNNINTVSILTNAGQGTFTLASAPFVGAGPSSVAAADVNGDGQVDLITANPGLNGITIITNDGRGGFVLAIQYSAGPAPVAVAAADVNGDGAVDLITANRDDNTLTVLTNRGRGAFVLASSPGVGNGPAAVSAADVNGDGRVDLIAANHGLLTLANTLSVLTNLGGGRFALASSPVVGYGPWSVAAADLNGDGRVDLASANGSENSVSVVFNAPFTPNLSAGNLFLSGGLVTLGRIQSPMWRATNVINTAGPLGTVGNFISAGGTLLISVSGSGYTASGNAIIGMNVNLDGVTLETCSITANPANTHLAFVPKTIVRTGIPPGPHLLSLSPLAGTVTDSYDNFCVTIQELPY